MYDVINNERIFYRLSQWLLYEWILAPTLKANTPTQFFFNMDDKTRSITFVSAKSPCEMSMLVRDVVSTSFPGLLSFLHWQHGKKTLRSIKKAEEVRGTLRCSVSILCICLLFYKSFFVMFVKCYQIYKFDVCLFAHHMSIMYFQFSWQVYKNVRRLTFATFKQNVCFLACSN